MHTNIRIHGPVKKGNFYRVRQRDRHRPNSHIDSNLCSWELALAEARRINKKANAELASVWYDESADPAASKKTG